MIGPDEYYRLRKLDLKTDESILAHMDNQLERALVERQRNPFIDTHNWQPEEVNRAQELARENGWKVVDGDSYSYEWGFHLVKPPPEKQSWLSRIFQ